MTTEEPIAPAAAAAVTAPSQGAKGNHTPASQRDAQQQHEQQANTNPNTTTPPTSADPADANGTDVDEEDPDLSKRVYAGNLNFATGEEELKAAFVKFGEIKDVSIVRYNSRHMGFGFVTYENDADALKAIEAMNKTTLQDREISVQSARSKAESKRRRALRKARTPRRKKNTKSKQGTENKDPESANAEPSTDKEGDQTTDKKSTRKSRNRRTKAQGTTDRPKPARGPPSTTTVFVGNLPFSLKDEELKTAFTDEGLNVASAYVVHGRGRMAHRSKGFGFVELSDETQQKRAVDVMHNKKLQERAISVRVALEKVANGDSADGDSEVKEANGDADVVKAETQA